MVFNWFKRIFDKNLSETDRQTNRQTDLVPSDIEKDSLQLGFAAGYTGRSIHDINAALSRIETVMPTKDWLLIQFEEQLKRHEEAEERRLQATLNALVSLKDLSFEAPEPLKARLLNQITSLESKLTLSRRMTELIQLVRYSKEVSFEELARKMNLSGSGLRTLVMMTLQRTKEVEKFNIGNKKWLRYRQTDVSDVQTDSKSTGNQENEQSHTQN